MKSAAIFRQKNGLSENSTKAKPFFQAKLTVNQPGDSYEQEADTVADRVMRMSDTPQQAMPFSKVSVADLQRKCAACEEEHVQRKGSGGGVQTAPTSVSSVISGSGQPLDSSTQQFMEGRMGQDFSQVQIHTDGQAAASAQAINALAYTSGKHIVFNSGQYQPHSESGKRLLAHELVHVGQQGGGSNNQIQRTESVYQETVQTPPRASGGIYSGAVIREEFRNEADRLAGKNQINYHSLNVRFDENTCRLTVPLSFQFINQDASHSTSCNDISGKGHDPVRPVSATLLNDAKARFMREIPAALNNWYSLVMSQTECGRCREIPIVFDFVEVTNGSADYTVIFTANTGRSYVWGNTIALCGEDSLEMGTLTHEAGHFALGWGDEYHEIEGSRPTERERLGQYSRMAQDAPARLLEFHERHFAFATAFMQSVYPGCNPQLKRTRPRAVEFTIPFSIGGYSLSGMPNSSDVGISLGLQLGIPLTTMRRLSIEVGPNFSYLLLNRQFLTGVRLGLRAQLGSTVGIGTRIFGETGIQLDLSGSPAPHPYVEAGAGVDLRILNQVSLGFEGAGGALRLDAANPNSFFRAGFRFGVNF